MQRRSPMKKSHITGLAAAILAVPVLAVEPQANAVLGTSPTEIARSLAESGYEMTKYEHEGGRIEVYALKQGRKTEVYVDAETGRVMRIESPYSSDARLGSSADDQEIHTALAAQGYDIVKYERKQREIEVYAERDGRLWELKLDPVTGEVSSTKEEH
jgi:hypothetical protein